MSNAGQAATALAGAFAGFFLTPVFGPQAIAYGLQIGLLAGTLLFPTQLPKQIGPRMEDLQTTVAQLGEPVGIVYGTFAVPGQVIALGCVTEVKRKEHVGGKGPPEQTVVTFDYYQTIAVGLCEGPICGLQRVWENGELKYDIRDQLPDEDDETFAARTEASGLYAATFTLYLGTEEQGPDPDLETIYGEGLVPGFRGLAYMVFPDRHLLTEQALRHPQWRFEVIHGAGERSVTAPTLIDDGPLDSFQTTYLMVDWARNRFFCFDLVGDADHTGIRAFSLRDNTETMQRTMADIGIGDPLAFYKGTVGLDGFIYLVVTYDNQGPAVIYRIDPETLDIVQTSTESLSRNQWAQATTIRVNGFGQQFDLLFTSAALNNSFRVRRCDTLVLMDDYEDTNEEGSVCPGAVDGITSYAWGLSYDEASFGTSFGIDVLKLTATVDISATTLEIVPSANIEKVGSLLPTALKSDWVRIAELSGLVYDQSDGCLIFCVTGATTTAVTPVERLVVKLDPDALEVVYAVPDVFNVGVTSDDNHNLSRVVSGRYSVAAPLGTVTHVDTTTGEQTQEDWSDALPGTGTFTGNEIYDGYTDCLITYIGNVGPVLVCGPGCSDEAVTLGDIVADVCVRSGVPDDGYDVSELTQPVPGFGILRNSVARTVVEALRPIAAFDAVESGTVIRFPVRGRAVSKTFVEDELGAFDQGDNQQGPPLVTTDKKQPVDLPRLVRLHYTAPSRDYEPGEKLSVPRFSPGIENELDVEVPAALDDTQALRIADVVMADAWAGRWSHSTAWDVSQLALEPTDVVLLPVDGRLYRCRISDIEDVAGGLLRKPTLIRDDDGSYVSKAVSQGPLIPTPTGPRIISTTSLVLLDLPPLREEDDNAGIYAAVYRSDPARSWSGVVIARSVDDGATFTQLAAATDEATVGYLTDALGLADPYTWDTRGEVLVHVVAGSFESREESAVINGANTIAVGANGRWEILQFRDAELTGTNLYRLSYLLRGRRGTEPYIGTGQAGDGVVLLSDGALLRLPLQTSDIGQEYQYRPTSVGLAAGATDPQPFTGQGRALLPWAPVYIRGDRDLSGDLTISFSRRSRLGSDLLPSGESLPLTDEPEAYEIDVYDGVDVVRTIDTAVESALYTSAQQVTDFGGAQDSVHVKIYQVSAVVGRGLAGEATV